MLPGPVAGAIDIGRERRAAAGVAHLHAFAPGEAVAQAALLLWLLALDTAGRSPFQRLLTAGPDLAC